MKVSTMGSKILKLNT